MGLLSKNSEKLIKNELRSAGRPLEQEELIDRTKLEEEEVREAVRTLVDRGEVRSTVSWSYELVE